MKKVIRVMGESKMKDGAVQTISTKEEALETDFEAIGLATYFMTDEDNKVNWEDFFDIKGRPYDAASIL